MTRLIRSFRHAIAGVRHAISTQANIRLHFAAAIAAIGAGAFLLPHGQTALIVLVCGLVIVAELANTALEALVDLVSPDYHPLAKAAKDVAAGGVLLSACTATGVGAILFIPAIAKLVASG